MTRETAGPFEGIPREAVDFLRALARNNDTAWFDRHRPEYDSYVVEPMRRLVREFSDWMNAEVDAGIESRPQVGRAIGRIRRDTRFSRDKRPYKETVWIIFRNRRAVMTTLGFYWELTTTGYLYGMGFYSAPPRVLRAVRERALAEPAKFREAIAPIGARPELRASGEPYRRSSMPGAPEDLRFWLDRKNLYVGASRPHDDVLHSRALVDLVWDAWDGLVPLYRFLRDSSSGSYRGPPEEAGAPGRRGPRR